MPDMNSKDVKLTVTPDGELVRAEAIDPQEAAFFDPGKVELTLDGKPFASGPLMPVSSEIKTWPAIMEEIPEGEPVQIYGRTSYDIAKALEALEDPDFGNPATPNKKSLEQAMRDAGFRVALDTEEKEKAALKIEEIQKLNCYSPGAGKYSFTASKILEYKEAASVLYGEEPSTDRK